MRQGRILVVGEAAVPTGFARVAHSLLEEWRRRYDVHHLSVLPFATLPDPPWPTYAAPRDSRELPGELARRVDGLRPDVVIVLHDLRTVAQLSGVLAARRHGHRTLSYSPLDSLPPEPGLARSLAAVDVVAAYTEAQREALVHALAGWARREPGLVLPEVVVLPHGVDTGRFRPLPGPGGRPDRAALKRRVFGEALPSPDAFVVLNAGRNHVRKRLDLTVEGFARFARTRPDAVLCLHCGTDDWMGWDLGALAARHGVADRVLHTAAGAVLPGSDDEGLNLIYNACDVGLNTSVGEGWGLPAFEHAATGAPQVMPAHTACWELWRGAARFIPASRPFPTLDLHRTERRVHPGGVADALAALYDDPALFRRLGEAAYRNATRPEYAWSVIARAWEALIDPPAGGGARRSPG